MITHSGTSWRRWKCALGALVTAGLVMGAAGAARADGGLTLDEAIRRALRDNPRLSAARAQADAAGSAAGAASWGRLPRVQGELGASRTDHPVYVFGSLLAQERFGPANFGTFNPQTGTFDLSILNTPDPVTNVRAAVSVHQPLWTGGALTSGVKASRAQAEAARDQSARAAQETAYNTEKAFRYSLLADEKAALLRESLATARLEAVRVESLWAEGLALQSDRQALKAHVLETEASLASAEADSAEARSMLGLVLGADGPVTDTLVQPDNGAGVSVPSLSAAIEASADRRDVQAAHQNARAASAGVGLARAQLFPAFEVMAQTEHNSKDFLGEGGNQWMVGLGARMSLDAGVAGRVRAARAKTRAAREMADAARENARHEVRTAYDRLQAAEQRVTALEAAVVSARESFDLMDKRHAEGLVTTLDLTQSQNNLTRTELAAASARHERALARTALELAAGTLQLPEESR
jgi:outer membrane protein